MLKTMTKPKSKKIKKPAKKPRKNVNIANKHKKVLLQLEDNIKKGLGNSLRKAMIMAGYSKSYAESAHIQEGKVWQSVLQDAMSDESILIVHQEGLKADRVIYATSDGTISDTINIPDYDARFKYLDSVYRLKAKYAPTQIEVKPRRNLEEVDEEIAAALSEIAELI